DTATVLKPGSDATLAAYGPSVQLALDAALAAEDEGIDLEVVDLRSISPIDTATLAESVERTGRLVVITEAPAEAGIASEIITSIVETSFTSLVAAPERVTGY